MKTHKKILVTLVFAVTALFTAMAAISAEEYVIGEEYYKDFPGSGHQLMKVQGITEYDERGNEIHWQSSLVSEVWYEYDEQGKLIYEKHSNGYELWYEYDERGNKIHVEDSRGEEEWYKYDANGNLIYWKDSDGGGHLGEPIGHGEEEWYEYDKEGRLISWKNKSSGTEWRYEYYKGGTQVYEQSSIGYERWFEYDEKGNQLYRKDSYDGAESWSEYNERGYIIHSIFTPTEIEYYGQEYWYEYTYWPDGTRKTRILFVREFNPSDFTFPPSPTFDYKTVKMQEITVEAGGIYRVSENLRLREYESTFSTVVTTMQAGTLVKVLSLGRTETIDWMESNWVQIEVQLDGKDKDGNPIKAGTTGWCFGGYLKTGEFEESELFVPPETTNETEFFVPLEMKILCFLENYLFLIFSIILTVVFIHNVVKIIKSIRARKQDTGNNIPVSSLILICAGCILTFRTLCDCILLISGFIFLLGFFASTLIYISAGVVAIVREKWKKKEVPGGLSLVITGEIVIFAGLLIFFSSIIDSDFIFYYEAVILIIGIAVVSVGNILVTEGVLGPKVNKKGKNPE